MNNIFTCKQQVRLRANTLSFLNDNNLLREYCYFLCLKQANPKGVFYDTLSQIADKIQRNFNVSKRISKELLSKLTQWGLLIKRTRKNGESFYVLSSYEGFYDSLEDTNVEYKVSVELRSLGSFRKIVEYIKDSLICLEINNNLKTQEYNTRKKYKKQLSNRCVTTGEKSNTVNPYSVRNSKVQKRLLKEVSKPKEVYSFYSKKENVDSIYDWNFTVSGHALHKLTGFERSYIAKYVKSMDKLVVKNNIKVKIEGISTLKEAVAYMRTESYEKRHDLQWNDEVKALYRQIPNQVTISDQFFDTVRGIYTKRKL